MGFRWLYQASDTEVLHSRKETVLPVAEPTKTKVATSTEEAANTLPASSKVALLAARAAGVVVVNGFTPLVLTDVTEARVLLIERIELLIGKAVTPPPCCMCAAVWETSIGLGCAQRQ